MMETASSVSSSEACSAFDTPAEGLTHRLGQMSTQPSRSRQPASGPPSSGIPRWATAFRRPDRLCSASGRNGYSSSDRQTGSEAFSSLEAIDQISPLTQEQQTRPHRQRSHKVSTSASEDDAGGQLQQKMESGARADAHIHGDSTHFRESGSDTSSILSSSGRPRLITSKIGSLANVQHKPGGGNVRIYDAKVDYSHAKSKCDTKANLCHQPGGGNVKIVDTKLNYKEIVKPKVNSFQNLDHVPRGGDVKITNLKLDFSEKASPKVESMSNIQHKPRGGDVGVYNERLPWLKYNKPNLRPEEKARINKHPIPHNSFMTEYRSSSNFSQ